MKIAELPKVVSLVARLFLCLQECGEEQGKFGPVTVAETGMLSGVLE